VLAIFNHQTIQQLTLNLLELLYQNPIIFVLWAVSLVIAVTIHEFAHAFIADKLGDPTPRAYGRVTLNPIAHMDPMGTIALLVANIGWGKPVPVDSYNFANPRRDTLLVSLAGPGSNILLASLMAILIRVFPIAAILGVPLIILNIGLAIFNLIPIPPLDGSKILPGLLSKQQAYAWEQMTERLGLVGILVLILPIFGGRSIISIVISPIISAITGLFIPY